MIRPCVKLVLLSLWLVAQSCSQPTPDLVIRNVNLIDVNTGDVLPARTIAIGNDRILDIDSTSDQTYENADVIDGSGQYAIPGLIDAHIHFFQSGSLYTRPDALDLRDTVPYDTERDFAWGLVPDHFRRYLRMGITTVMDMGGPYSNFAIRDSVAAQQLSPNVFVTGPLFSPFQPMALATDDPPIVYFGRKDQATNLFNKMLTYKPDYIKVWYLNSPALPAEQDYPVVEHIAKLTHQHGLKLAVHATELETAKLAVKAGADILVHSIEDEPLKADFIELLKENNVSYIPTLIVGDNYFKAFLANPEKHESDLYLGNPSVYGSLFHLAGYPDEAFPPRIQELKNNMSVHNRVRTQRMALMGENLYKLSKAGVNIITGTDAGNIGTLHATSYLQELTAMFEAKLSNYGILKASTINAAKGFGKEKLFGSLETGKMADVLLLGRNPLEEIGNLKYIEKIIKGGHVIDPDTLLQESPEMVVQRQLNAYNARDIEAFLSTYSDDVELINADGKVIMAGKEQMRQSYGSMFDNTPNLYCEIKDRKVEGNRVTDQEYVRVGERYIEAAAVYEVEGSEIVRVTFQ